MFTVIALLLPTYEKFYNVYSVIIHHQYAWVCKFKSLYCSLSWNRSILRFESIHQDILSFVQVSIISDELCLTVWTYMTSTRTRIRSKLDSTPFHPALGRRTALRYYGPDYFFPMVKKKKKESEIFHSIVESFFRTWFLVILAFQSSVLPTILSWITHWYLNQQLEDRELVWTRLSHDLV